MKKSKRTLLRKILRNIWVLEYLVTMKYNGFQAFFSEKCFLNSLENTLDFLRNLNNKISTEKRLKGKEKILLAKIVLGNSVGKEKNTENSARRYSQGYHQN